MSIRILLIIITLLFGQNIIAQESSLGIKDSLDNLYNFFYRGTINTKLDKNDIGYSGRGTWMSAFTGLISSYIKYDLDTEPFYVELCKIMTCDTFARNRLIAAKGLGYTRKLKAVKPLRKALNDKSLFVRTEAAISIIELGLSDDMEALQIIARTATYENIEKMTSIEAIDAGENPLIFLDSNDSDVVKRILKNHRRQAIDILKKSNSIFANEVIIKLRQDKDEEIRTWTNDGIKK